MWLLLSTLLALSLSSVNAITVLGIDFGHLWFKMAMISKSTYDIVLNEQSSRRTPTMVSFFEGDRYFGNEARSLTTRTPPTTMMYSNMLLGREYGEKLVESLRGSRLLYDLQRDEERNTYKVQVTPNMTLSPEELSGMVLRYAKALAKESAGEDVREVAITVPPYYTSAQRQALLDAARLAGLVPLALINEGTAAAISYLTKLNLDKLPHYMIVYDMGAQDTSASLFEIKVVNETRGKFAKKAVPVGVVETLAVVSDASLGGTDFDEALARRFVAAIKVERPDVDVFANGARAWSRLLKEANKVKEVLSANQEFTARVEGVVEGYDFKLPITRSEFETLCEPLLARVALPAVEALRRAGLTAKDLDLFELVGGGWRIPAVQKRLQQVVERPTLDQHINSDEGAVMGAAFYAASLTPGFRVKEFKIKDSLSYPIDVSARSIAVDKHVEALIESEDEVIDKSAPMWKEGSRLRSKKTLTFHSSRNLTFDLTYAADANLLPGQRRELASFAVSGVPNRFTHPNMTSLPKVTASFMLDGSGVVKLTRAEATIEIVELVMPKPAKPRPSAKKNDTSTAKSKDEKAKKATEQESADDDDADDATNDEKRAADDDDKTKTDNADDKEQPVEEKKVEGFGKVVAIDAGGELIAKSSRPHIEEWLGEALEFYEAISYASYVDRDGEFGYFFSIRVTNASESAQDEIHAYRTASEKHSRLNENSTEVENATAKATRDAALAALPAALASDTNKYIHVRVAYDPAGNKADATIGSADEDGVAEVDATPQMKVAVRGLLKDKTAADALAYFDENIVAAPKPVKRTLVVPLSINVTEHGVRVATADRNAAYAAQLSRLDAADVLKRDNADKKNAIEAYCYAMRDKLTDESFESASTAEEREKLTSALNDARDWLEGAGARATTAQYVDKLSALKALGDPIEARLREANEAPALAAKMRDSVKNWRNDLVKLTTTHDVTIEEVNGALVMLDKAEKWLTETEAAQAKLALYEKPALTVAAITEQFSKFEKRQKSLQSRKKRSTKPPPKKKKEDAKDKDKESDAKQKKAEQQQQQQQQDERKSDDKPHDDEKADATNDE